MRTRTDAHFEKGDPVRDYWLARGEGFAVETQRGHVVGHVVDTVLDPDEGRIVGLVVRRTLLGAVPTGTEEVPVDEIEAAVPARGAFVLDGAKNGRARNEPATAGPRQPGLLDRFGSALAILGRQAAQDLRRDFSSIRRHLRAARAHAGPAAARTGAAIRAAAAAVALWALSVGRWTYSALRDLTAWGVSEVKTRTNTSRMPD